MSIPLISDIVPQNNGAFPTHSDIYGKGGYQIRNDITDRDNIPTLNRKEGMLVKVISDGKVYELQSDLLTWSIFASGGGGVGSSGDAGAFNQAYDKNAIDPILEPTGGWTAALSNDGYTGPIAQAHGLAIISLVDNTTGSTEVHLIDSSTNNTYSIFNTSIANTEFPTDLLTFEDNANRTFAVLITTNQIHVCKFSYAFTVTNGSTNPSFKTTVLDGISYGGRATVVGSINNERVVWTTTNTNTLKYYVSPAFTSTGTVSISAQAVAICYAPEVGLVFATAAGNIYKLPLSDSGIAVGAETLIGTLASTCDLVFDGSKIIAIAPGTVTAIDPVSGTVLFTKTSVTLISSTSRIATTDLGLFAISGGNDTSTELGIIFDSFGNQVSKINNTNSGSSRYASGVAFLPSGHVVFGESFFDVTQQYRVLTHRSPVVKKDKNAIISVDRLQFPNNIGTKGYLLTHQLTGNVILERSLSTIFNISSDESVSRSAALSSYHVDTSTGPVNITLGFTFLSGDKITVKDVGGIAANNNIVVTGSIDGQLNYIINTNYGVVELEYNGSIWSVISTQTGDINNSIIGDNNYATRAKNLSGLGIFKENIGVTLSSVFEGLTSSADINGVIISTAGVTGVNSSQLGSIVFYDPSNISAGLQYSGFFNANLENAIITVAYNYYGDHRMWMVCPNAIYHYQIDFLNTNGVISISNITTLGSLTVSQTELSAKGFVYPETDTLVFYAGNPSYITAISSQVHQNISTTTTIIPPYTLITASSLFEPTAICKDNLGRIWIASGYTTDFRVKIYNIINNAVYGAFSTLLVNSTHSFQHTDLLCDGKFIYGLGPNRLTKFNINTSQTISSSTMYDFNGIDLVISGSNNKLVYDGINIWMTSSYESNLVYTNITSARLIKLNPDILVGGNEISPQEITYPYDVIDNNGTFTSVIPYGTHAIDGSICTFGSNVGQSIKFYDIPIKRYVNSIDHATLLKVTDLDLPTGTVSFAPGIVTTLPQTENSVTPNTFLSITSVNLNLFINTATAGPLDFEFHLQIDGTDTGDIILFSETGGSGYSINESLNLYANINDPASTIGYRIIEPTLSGSPVDWDSVSVDINYQVSKVFGPFTFTASEDVYSVAGEIDLLSTPSTTDVRFDLVKNVAGTYTVLDTIPFTLGNLTATATGPHSFLATQQYYLVFRPNTTNQISSLSVTIIDLASGKSPDIYNFVTYNSSSVISANGNVTKFKIALGEGIAPSDGNFNIFLTVNGIDQYTDTFFDSYVVPGPGDSIYTSNYSLYTVNIPVVATDVIGIRIESTVPPQGTVKWNNLNAEVFIDNGIGFFIDQRDDSSIPIDDLSIRRLKIDLPNGALSISNGLVYSGPVSIGNILGTQFYGTSVAGSSNLLSTVEASPVNGLILADGYTYGLKITCVAGRNSTSKRAIFINDVLAHCQSGTATIDLDNLTYDGSGSTLWTFAVGTSTNKITLTFTSDVSDADTIAISATIIATKVQELG